MAVSHVAGQPQADANARRVEPANSVSPRSMEASTHACTICTSKIASSSREIRRGRFINLLHRLPQIHTLPSQRLFIDQTQSSPPTSTGLPACDLGRSKQKRMTLRDANSLGRTQRLHSCQYSLRNIQIILSIKSASLQSLSSCTP